jgi:hypothetical protein
LCFLSAVALANTSSVVYNHIGAQRTLIDGLVHEHFEKFRRVVDVRDVDHTYVNPKPVGQRAGNPPVYIQQHCIRGSALVLYIIETNGSVSSPFVARSSDPALAIEALARVSSKRFMPAELDGETVATVAITPYQFTCPPDGE